VTDAAATVVLPVVSDVRLAASDVPQGGARDARPAASDAWPVALPAARLAALLAERLAALRLAAQSVA
jgi:hypothetical protein